MIDPVKKDILWLANQLKGKFVMHETQCSLWRVENGAVSQMLLAGVTLCLQQSLSLSGSEIIPQQCSKLNFYQSHLMSTLNII